MVERSQYEVVIGLEVHAQLQTRTKLFCSDTTPFGNEPNTQVSAISLGHPGTLPRMNKEAISLAITLGLATHCTILQQNYFVRKNYFYPDLPKGYQISQHTTPICRSGFMEINTGTTTTKVRINRIHLEEDAGKSIHVEESPVSYIDCNRAGMPLLEIVTEPDIRSAEEAFAFVTSLRKLVRYLGVCDGNMEKGSLRCDVNISVRVHGDPRLGTKVEIKNLNSIRFIKKAVEHESARLIAMHQKGETILQQTRGLDEVTFTTYPIRTKEDEDDYRYFPEPDLPPLYITEDLMKGIQQNMPALPTEVAGILMNEYGLSPYDASQISEDAELSYFFFELVKQTKNHKAAANWIIGPLQQFLSGHDISLAECGIQPAPVAALIQLIEEGKISYAMASQKVFPELTQHPAMDIVTFIKEHDLYMEASEGEMDRMVEQALHTHAQKIAAYKKGKKGLLGVFVGEVMKLSRGKVDAQLITKKIIEKLNT